MSISFPVMHKDIKEFVNDVKNSFKRVPESENLYVIHPLRPYVSVISLSLVSLHAHTLSVFCFSLLSNEDQRVLAV